MQTAAPGEFPHSLDRIQFGAVGRQEVQSEAMTGLLFSPAFVETSVVIFGIVGDDDDAAAGSGAGTSEVTEKAEEGFVIEPGFLAAKPKRPSPNRTAPK